MSADLLREAAALMRERAEAAAGIFAADDCNWHESNEIACALEDGGIATVTQATPDAEHIASWHPAVALAVADWLEESAEHLEIHEDDDIPDGLREAICPTALEGPDCSVLGQAAMVARAYLGRDA